MRWPRGARSPSTGLRCPWVAGSSGSRWLLKEASTREASFLAFARLAPIMVRGGALMAIPFLIFLAAVGAIVIFVIVSYNRLVSLTQRTQSAWSDVDVQLKRRTDLVPNLVESVKGYAAHERGTLDAVIRARGAAVAAQTPESRAQAEGQLTQALRGLFALAESYPDLKASANFQALQASLEEIEDAVQSARRYFNAVVRDLNTTIEIFPSNLVAGLFQFREHAYFELDRPEERQVPTVSFGA